MPTRVYPIPRLTPNDKKRFWQKVQKDGPNGHWIWTAATRHGYGVFYLQRKYYMSHRIGFYLGYGRDPFPKLALHKVSCSQRACCNFRHLYAGTDKDNLYDWFNPSDDRRLKLRGEDHGMSKLTKSEVVAIRKYRPPIGRPSFKNAHLSWLARTFHVSRGTIKSVRAGKTWKHVPMFGCRPLQDVRILTADDVRTIRRSRNIRNTILAAKFNVTAKHIGSIKNGQKWKHLPLHPR
jgi:hypothetical protein